MRSLGVGTVTPANLDALIKLIFQKWCELNTQVNETPADFSCFEALGVDIGTPTPADNNYLTFRQWVIDTFCKVAGQFDNLDICFDCADAAYVYQA